MSEKTYQVTSTETIDSCWGWLYKIGGVAALIAGMLLLIGAISLIASALQPNAIFRKSKSLWARRIGDPNDD